MPPEELASVERICFQVEEAQWFYEDFIRPLDPSLPSLTLRAFSLRIFQHCPLFSQWSEKHHTTAFAEFLAYKSRVPVRGAILLNEAMDEVVLVKGWKKSANWSFPRGKINKDENDLDCAIREVYEETGFDVREAGLVKDERDHKYIEVTMREQHMRLYVFRGVPKDAHFEPKTRKEISKIQWYKLTDLPTLKKSRQHEGSGTDHASINANKFYMVAPFLNPLKKWIAQQRKKEGRYSSHLAAPPMIPEDLTTEEEERDNRDLGARLAETGPFPVSDLPEVSAPPPIDPTAHLKEMLQLGVQNVQHTTELRPSHMPQVDSQKSNALLALLRGNQQGSSSALPHTPLEQMFMPPEVQQSPRVSHVRQPQLDQALPPPPFQSSPDNQRQLVTEPRFPRPQAMASAATASQYLGQSAPPVAPYQRTGDPLSMSFGAAQQQLAVPPASALPKLTNHTKALLEVFKGATGTSSVPNPPAGASILDALIGADTTRRLGGQGETMSSTLGSARQVSEGPTRDSAPAVPNANTRVAPDPGFENQGPSILSSGWPRNAQKSSLLELFSQPATASSVQVTAPPPAPVELAATTTADISQNPQINKDDLLLTLLRQGSQGNQRKASEGKRPIPREGETSATVNGPLNQPEFEAISRTTRHATNDMGRSPLSGNRKLYDPNAPAPVKILTRSEEPRSQPPRSPRGTKQTPKRTTREKSTPKEQTKPFQPQILRRPQTSEGAAPNILPLMSEASTQHSSPTAAAAGTVSSPIISDGDVGEKWPPSRKASQNEAQKQTLLSLFGGGLDTTPQTTTMQTGPGVVSPLTASQLMTANAEGPLSGIDPISTRASRMSSMASIASGPGSGRVMNEKRQTGAENKAFLLGYLGRIATQEK